jgi:hypothetical protein
MSAPKDYRQSLVDAQVSINRCVWAMNTVTTEPNKNLPQSFKTDKDRRDYILTEAKDAINELTQAIKAITDAELIESFT